MQKTKTETHQAGFTLIEVIAVLVIIAIVAAVAISKGISNSQISAVSEADILKANLRFAQLKAMQEDQNQNGTTSYWGIYFSGNAYTLYNGSTAASINLPSETSSTHTFSGGVTAVSPSPNPVSFNDWGSPVDTSGNPLSASLTITLNSGSHTAQVTVTQNTGFIQ